jgi:hypothetical protein
MSPELEDRIIGTVKGMEGDGPRPLASRIALEAEELGEELTLADLIDSLIAAGPNNSLRRVVSLQLARWDAIEAEVEWTSQTDSRTPARRHVIYDRLKIDPTRFEDLDESFPVKQDGNIVISEEFTPWYTAQRRSERAFYWPAYENYLMEQRQWEDDSLKDLDSATTDVVARLADPTQEEVYQSKGLVVGYVQSGKTANFTGVIAKAIDAGYRLIIVLTGTIDMLREQTQRRLDKELVGRENILKGRDPDDPESLVDVDYQTDTEWIDRRFIEHGILPSDQNLPDVIRLTNYRFSGRTGDYRSLKAGISALEIERVDRTLPLYHPTNLPRSSARLAVVKKNKGVLDRLVKDLKAIRPQLGEIPALIIDDESDQASINTVDKRKWKAGQKARTAINGSIAELLELLPRAQYVGYTATPFANVFVDPGDAQDIFPKDFLISLDRPPGYMGVSDFHDIDSAVDPEDRTVANSNELAHVRDLRGEGTDRLPEIRDALRSFVLAGAIKLYRESVGAGTYRHHTMLMHESHLTAEHTAQADEAKAAWRSAGMNSPSGLLSLRSAYEDDFVPVSQAQGGVLPDDFEQLKPFVADALTRITSGGDPVIIVNGDKAHEQEELNFEERDIWRILVGGAKLSRGFTVEGLTTTYYRRRTKQADTLMQMGRWFGFRRGYKDLVRLYVGRDEPDGRGRIDLYKAFEAIVRDEEQFRSELEKYSETVDGKPQIRPLEIPPLVSQHLPWLRPAARNKMFNARLVVRRSPGTPIEPVAYPKAGPDRVHNYNAMLPLLKAATTATSFAIPEAEGRGQNKRLTGEVRRSFDAFLGNLGHQDFLAALRDLRWMTEDAFDADLQFLAEIEDRVDDWAIVLPQAGKHGQRRTLPEVDTRSVFLRAGMRGDNFHAISEERHRYSVRRIAGAIDSYGDSVADPLSTGRRGGVLIYPIVQDKLVPAVSFDEIITRDLVVAMTIVAPSSVAKPGQALVQFEVRNSALENQPIIDKVEE